MRAWKFFFLFLAILLMAEASLFAVIRHLSSRAPAAADLVLVYSGAEGRAAAGLEWSGKLGSKDFLYSGWDLSDPGHEFARMGHPKNLRILLEGKAHTTDQNARYCAPILQSTGARTVALVLPWYHLPRSYCLTLFYLRGTGIRGIPVSSPPFPRSWWMSPVIFTEFIKFWGSWGRILLNLVDSHD